MKSFISILLTFLLSQSFAQEDFEIDFDFNDGEIKEDTNDSNENFNFESFENQNEIDQSVQDLKFSEEDLTPVENNPKLPKSKKLSPKRKLTSSKRGRYIYHPNQEKGLYKINRENEYLYKYKKSKIKGALSFKGGATDFKNLTQAGSESNFKDFYKKDTATTFLLEYDWAPFKKHKSLNLKGGMGLAYARGTGRFSTAQANPNLEAREKYNFLYIPIHIGITYKFKFVNDQLFLPFVTGGLDYSLLTEFRKSFEALKYNGILGAHLGGGLGINLGWLERSASLQLDQEFGINNTYLILEARTIISFEDENDINGFMFVAGLSFEY